MRTDFILSAEIIVIALGTVDAAPFIQRVLVLSAVGVLMTVGVYGLVGGIVKLDDLGMYLTSAGGGALGALLRKIGGRSLAAAPLLMKALSVLGTAAMFLVGGGIFSHGWQSLHDLIEKIRTTPPKSPALGGSSRPLPQPCLTPLRALSSAPSSLLW